MCAQKAHKRKIEMSKFAFPRGLSTFSENFRKNFPEVTDHIFLMKNLMKKSTKKRSMISRFISQSHQFWCDSSESEIFYTYDIDTNVCGTKNLKNKYVHTYDTKSQILVKNFLKLHFFRLWVLYTHTVGQFSKMNSFNTLFWHISISQGNPWRLWSYDNLKICFPYSGTLWKLPLTWIFINQIIGNKVSTPSLVPT